MKKQSSRIASTMTHAKLLAVALLPLLTEAMMHHPGMYGGYGNHNESSSSS